MNIPETKTIGITTDKITKEVILSKISNKYKIENKNFNLSFSLLEKKILVQNSGGKYDETLRLRIAWDEIENETNKFSYENLCHRNMIKSETVDSWIFEGLQNAFNTLPPLGKFKTQIDLNTIYEKIKNNVAEYKEKEKLEI